MSLLPADVDQLPSYGGNVDQKVWMKVPSHGVSARCSASGADLAVYLHCSKDSSPSEQIEGHLPAKRIKHVLDDPGKPGAESIVVEITRSTAP
jgi:hypothetical protein